MINLLLVKNSKLEKRGYLTFHTNGCEDSATTSTAYILPKSFGKDDKTLSKGDFLKYLDNLRYSHGCGDWRNPKFYECPIFEVERESKISAAISFFQSEGYSIWAKSTIEYCVDCGYTHEEMRSTLINSGAIK